MGRIDQLNLNLLRTFAAVARHGGVSAAARALGLTQPTVSQALGKIERELGCRLVLRSSRRLALTSAGEAVRDECEAILAAVERIAARTRAMRRPRLTISIVSNLTSPLIDEALRLQHQREPDTELRIEVRNSHEIVERMRARLSGVGLCLLPRPLDDLDCRLLYREEFAVFCGAEHGLWGEAEVAVERLRREPFVEIACAADPHGFEPMEALRREAGLGVDGRVSGTSANLEEVGRMIAAGFGIGVLPVAAAAAAVSRGRLWPLRVTEHPLGADVFLIRGRVAPEDSPESRFRALIEELLPHFPDLH